MFTDDSEVFCFSRRLAWSPDGSFFIVPCGYYQQNTSSDTQYVSYGFLRHETSDPAFVLPSSKTCPIVVRFCPVLFKREEDDEPFIDLPYIVVWAIATQEQVMIYSSRSTFPFAVVSNIHYAELTDATWSTDD